MSSKPTSAAMSCDRTDRDDDNVTEKKGPLWDPTRTLCIREATPSKRAAVGLVPQVQPQQKVARKPDKEDETHHGDKIMITPEVRQFALERVKANPESFTRMSQHIRGDKELVINALRQKLDGIFEHTTRDLKADKDVVMSIIEGEDEGGTCKAKPEALQYAAEALKADKEFVMKLAQKGKLDLQYAADSLRADREVVLASVKVSPSTFRHAAESLRADCEFIFQAIESNKGVLSCIDGVADQLFKNRTFLRRLFQHVKLYVTNHNEYPIQEVILDRTAETLVQDPELCREAIELGVRLVRLLALVDGNTSLEKDLKALKSHRGLFLEALKRGQLVLSSASDDLRADHELVLEAAKVNPFQFQYACPELKADRKLVLEIVKHRAEVLRHASPELTSDTEIVLVALSNDPQMPYLSPDLREDPVFLAQALEVVYDKKIGHIPRLLTPGPKLDDRLRSGIAGLSRHSNGKSSLINLRCLNAVRECAARMKHITREKDWLVDQVTATLPIDINGLVQELADSRASYDTEIQQANSIIFCAPLFALFSKRGTNWKDIPLLFVEGNAGGGFINPFR